MKRLLLSHIILLFFAVFSTKAANLYWVGGSGTWSDAKHWAASSGGKGGFAIPSPSDNVFFDQNSFGNKGQIVSLVSSASCQNMIWQNVPEGSTIYGAPSSDLSVFGTLSFDPNTKNAFAGTVYLKAEAPSIIRSAGTVFQGSLYIDGLKGTFLLNDDLQTLPTSVIYLRKGSFSTAGHTVDCGSFIALGTAARSLSLSSSKVFVEGSWNLSEDANLSFTAGTSQIIFKKSLKGNSFSSGNFKYASISSMLSMACTVTVTGVNLKCNSVCTGTATASVTGAIGPVTYTWSPSNQTTQTATGLCAGTYLVQVTDSLGNICFGQIPITEPPALLAACTFTPALCNGVCNATANVNAVGGTPAYTYSWNPTGKTTASISGICAGQIYTVTVTDNNLCSKTATVNVTQPTVLVANGSSQNVRCFGACDGTATVNPTGGTTPYTYSWNPGGQITQSRSGLCPGNYTCTVTDKNGCTSTYTTNITQPAPLASQMAQTNVSCNGVCDGTASTTASGGTVNYTYSWNPGGQTTASVSGLCAGSYTLTITDANACTLTRTVNITQPAVLNSVPTQVNITCNGSCNGTANANASGGTPTYTYSWNPGGLTTANISGLCPGGYTVTVTDSKGCTKTASVNITEPAALGLGISTVNVSCNGMCNGTASVTASGGTGSYTYSWNPGGQTTANVSGLCPNTYTLTVTDGNGCTRTSAVNITQPAPLLANAVKTNALCNGACNGTATANPSGGTPSYTYSWSAGAQTTQSISGLCAGSYTVRVTDSKGCTTTQAVVVGQPNVLTATINSTMLLCNGNCIGTAAANVSGGTALFSFSWAPGGQSTQTITGLCAGTYTVTVTDANNCTTTQTTNITQPTALQINTAGTNVSCNGGCNGTASALAGGGTGPYTYSWTPGGQSTSSINGLCAGVYTVTATDKNGCTITATFNVTQPPPLLANAAGVNVTCSGACDGSASANASGGTSPYTYSWNPGGQATTSISGLCPGIYTVTVTDNKGCTRQQTVQITQPAPLNPTITGNNSSCGVCNGSASASALGGTSPYTYSWNNGQTNSTATGLCPNNYTVTITDSKGCTSTISVAVVQLVQIIINNSGTQPKCTGSCDGQAVANAVGGTQPYSYLWSNGQTTQTTTGLCAGSYTVTVTDSVGCFSTAMITMVDPPLLALSTTFTNASCNGFCNGTATASASGGTPTYTYSWSAGAQTAVTATGLCAGSYTVLLTDNNGCTRTASVTIGQSTAITTSVTVTNATCTSNNGSITLTAGGGAGSYTYSWSPGGQSTSGISNQFAGVYTVTVTDGGGCSGSFAIAINNTNGPNVATAGINIQCNGACTGSASITASAGVSPYTYSWVSGGQTTTSASALCAGNQIVRVTDANGCITFATVTITQPQPLLASSTVVNASCSGSCNGRITTTASGGTGSYTYSWNPGGQTTSSISALCSGGYTLTLTDGNSCTRSFAFNVTQPSSLNLTMSSTNANCSGSCNGTASVSVTGGTPSYTYSWNPGGFVTSSIVNKCVGTYTVTVTDAQGCTMSGTVAITEPTALTSTVTITNIQCNGQCNGSLSVSASGGTTNYTYSWSPGGQVTSSISNLCAGTYSVTVTDAQGCTSVQSANITEPAAINPNVVNTSASCNGSCDATATSNATGGTGSYTYSWAPGGMTTASVSGLCPGGSGYTVTVTDANGCTGVQIFNIPQPGTLVPNTSFTSPTCNGGCNGTATANPFGGTTPYTYSWAPGGQTTATATNLCAGSYTVTVTDQNGCTATQVVNVLAPTAIAITPAVSPANCGSCDGIITVTPSNGTSPYTYSWNTGATTASISNLCANIYTITVTDAKGCTNSFQVVLNNTGGPTGETVIQTNVTCNGMCDGTATINPIGGVSPYTYSWVVGGQTTNSKSGLCAGTHFLKVTDSNGCIRFSPVTITEPAPLLTASTSVNAACQGICTGSVTTTITGGTASYTYSWQPGGQTTSSITGQCPGSYTLTVTDSKGCSRVDTLVVGANTIINLALSSVSPTCNGLCNGSISSTVSGGVNPYTYSWNPGGATTTSISSVCAGVYTLTVTDNNGCQATATLNLTEPAVLNPNTTPTNPLCAGNCNGTVVSNVTGGTSPYTFTWSTGGTTNSISSLCAGIYSVMVTDANGCTAVKTDTLVSPVTLGVIYSVTNSSCNTVPDGSVSTTVSGGTGVYTYSWNPGGLTTANVSNVLSGNYTLTVTDANGCTNTTAITILSTVTVLSNPGNDTSICVGGVIVLDGSGSVNAASYTWTILPSGNQISTTTTVTVTPTSTTSYVLEVANGSCIDKDTITITVNPLPIVDAGANKSIIINTTTVQIGGNPTASGGGTPYTYAWYPKAGLSDTTSSNPNASPTVTTMYYVKVTNANGCESLDSVLVTVFPQIIFPNGISPNGDGANDEWIIDNIELFPQCIVEIYNRWGELLFHSDGYPPNDRWKGVYKGKPLPVGTYYYIINLNDPLFPDVFTGPITLLR